MPMTNTTKYEGETVRIKCEITGQPLPRYQWFKDGVLLEGLQTQTSSRYSAKTTAWGSRLKIDDVIIGDTGLYTCEGYNKFGRQAVNGSVTIKSGPNPNRGRDDDFDSDTSETFPSRRLQHPQAQQHNKDRVRQHPQQRVRQPIESPASAEYGDTDEYSDVDDDVIESYCQPYNGVACTNYVGGQNVYISGRFQQGNVDETISAALSVIASLDTGGGQSDYQLYQCSALIASALCQFAFPVCLSQHSTSTTLRRLCRTDCLTLENDICRTLYELTRSHPAISSQLVLPECKQLPNDDANCAHINLISDVDYRHQCYNASGVDYRGIESVSASGNVCLRWTSTMSAHYNLGDHNYCRNPDNKLSAPWCFTANNRPELCAVNKCLSMVVGGSRAESNAIVQILVPCLCIPLVVILLLITIHLRRRCKSPATPTKSAVVTRRQHCLGSAGNNHPMELNPMLVGKSAPVKCMTEYPTSSIKYLTKLCAGHYGPVYRAELTQPSGTPASLVALPVAVRSLSTTASHDLRNEFWAEAECHSLLSHPNIVCLVGVCRGAYDCPPGLLYEFAFYGDLHEYLAVHSPHSDIAVVDESGRQQILQSSDMLRVAVQLAAGMEYLSSHQVVHKDLATRNVLVGNMAQVKISQLGLGRDTYPLDYYTPPGSPSALPVRWMAPESVLRATFSVESDVWSYGVTLWEVYSYGLQPYCGHTNQDVINMVNVHQVLPCPVSCPPSLYSLMLDCWNVVPSSRPSFATLHHRLRHSTDSDHSALTTATTDYSLSSCPPYSADQGPGVISCYPFNYTTSPGKQGGTVPHQSAFGQLVFANNVDTTVWPTSNCVGVPITTGLMPINYFRHQSDTPQADTTSANRSSCPSSSAAVSQKKTSSRTSNHSSLSSTSDCKSPRWPSVNHSQINDVISFSEPKTRQNDVTNDVVSISHQQSRTSRL